MNTRVKILFDEAGKLSPDEREALAEMLLSSIDDQGVIDEAWAIEAERRWVEFKASGAQLIDALEALDTAKALLRHGRQR